MSRRSACNQRRSTARSGVHRALLGAAVAGLAAGCGTLFAPDYIALLAAGARTPEELGRTALPLASPLPSWTMDGTTPSHVTLALVPPESTRNAPFPMTYVRVNDARTFALFDTGSCISLMDGRSAVRAQVAALRLASLGGSNAPPALLRSESQGLSCRIPYLIAAADHLHLGDAALSTGYLGVLDQKATLAPFGWINATPSEMLIGCDILRLFSQVVVDLPRASIELFNGRPAPAEALPRGVPVGRAPLMRDLHPVLPVVQVLLDTGIQVPVVIDTGGDLGLCLPPSLARQAGVTFNPFERGIVVVRTAGGESGYWPAQPHRVELGGLSLGEIETGVSVVGLHQTESKFGVLGLRALKRFRLTFDFANGQVELR